MSNLAKKRAHWYEVNEDTGEVIADEDVDVLTSADAVTFDDGDTLQRKYDDNVLAKSSDVGLLKGLSTTNKSSLVDAVNEVNTSVASNTKSIETLNANMTGDIESAVNTAKEYTDTKIANLVGTAPDTLDTLEEVAKAIDENEDVVTALNSAIGTKANQSDLDSLTTKVNTNTTNISNLQTSLNTTNTNVTNLTTKVTNVENTMPKIQASTTDLTAGTSTLASGTLYCVYE